MKNLFFLCTLYGMAASAQMINGVQLFNPKTNDNTPIIGFNEQLILKFDDFSNKNTPYRYTIKHFDKNWQNDGLFFTEYAKGSLNALLDNYQSSFNTYQPYTHYELAFPNEKIRPILSGNYEIIVYKDNVERPLLKKRFCIVEDNASVAIEVARHQNAQHPEQNQRLKVVAVGLNASVLDNINNITLSLMQNNNWEPIMTDIRPSATLGNRLMFQQPSLSFAGNNEFYYFNNRVIDQAFDTVARTENQDGTLHTHLHPAWAYPQDYQYQPDVNGAYYFRKSDATGGERNPDREGDYSWVHFYLPSEPSDKAIYVLGGFNDYKADDQSQMHYNPQLKMYEAKIYLKQGFYNYLLATKNPDGSLNYGEVNGNFWQTENLYQGLLYYRPFGKNYDGILGYGEYRTPVR